MKLLVDVITTTPGLIFIEELLEPLFKDLRDKKGIDDWRVIDYSKGKVYVTAYLLALKELPDMVAISRRSALYDVVSEALIPRANGGVYYGVF